MKYIFSLFLVYCSLNLSAQSNWSVGVVGGFDIASASKRARGVYFDAHPFLKKSIVVPRYGANIQYSFNEMVSVKTGFRYNIQGARYSYGDQLLDADIPVETIFKKKYIEIPLHLKFKIASGVLNYFIEGGASPNYYLGTKWGGKFTQNSDFEYGEELFDDSETITVSMDLGFGLERRINEKVDISIQSMVRYFPITEDEPWETNFLNVGIELGCSYNLN